MLQFCISQIQRCKALTSWSWKWRGASREGPENKVPYSIVWVMSWFSFFFSNHAQLPLALDVAVVVEVAVALGLAVEVLVGVGVVVAAAVLVVVVYVYVFLIVMYSQYTLFSV